MLTIALFVLAEASENDQRLPRIAAQRTVVDWLVLREVFFANLVDKLGIKQVAKHLDIKSTICLELGGSVVFSC